MVTMRSVWVHQNYAPFPRACEGPLDRDSRIPIPIGTGNREEQLNKLCAFPFPDPLGKQESGCERCCSSRISAVATPSALRVSAALISAATAAEPPARDPRLEARGL